MDNPNEGDMIFGMSKGTVMDAKKSEVLQGTLDLMILKTLHGLGPLHGLALRGGSSSSVRKF